MPRVNVIDQARQAVYSVWENDAELMAHIDSKLLKRNIVRDDFEPGQAPFLASWVSTPLPEWRNMAAVTEFNIAMECWGSWCSNDREDFSGIDMLFTHAVEALREDLCSAGSILRSQGLISKFMISNPTFLYARDVQTDQGIFFVEWSVNLENIRNPNAG